MLINQCYAMLELIATSSWLERFLCLCTSDHNLHFLYLLPSSPTSFSPSCLHRNPPINHHLPNRLNTLIHRHPRRPLALLQLLLRLFTPLFQLRKIHLKRIRHVQILLPALPAVRDNVLDHTTVFLYEIDLSFPVKISPLFHQSSNIEV
jgi:hypothetical protein